MLARHIGLVCPSYALLIYYIEALCTMFEAQRLILEILCMTPESSIWARALCARFATYLRKKQSLRSAFPPATTAGRCLHTISLFKPINSSANIDKPLYSGIEGMAFRTNFHFYVFSCASCWNDFSASTCHRGLFVFWVNIFFHVFTFFPI